MSRNLKIARPYAKAAFELAQEENAFSEWSEMLQTAVLIASDESVARLMKDPKCSSKKLIELFLEVGKKVFSEKQQYYIKILGRFKRLSFLPEIAQLFEKMKSAAQRVMAVELISAFPVSEGDEQRFVRALKARMHCEIVLECVTDKSILGGAIIRSGDLVIDGSVRGKLRKLTEAMEIL